MRSRACCGQVCGSAREEPGTFLPMHEELSLHALVQRPMSIRLPQVLVPDGVDDKDASQFLVNPVTGTLHSVSASLQLKEKSIDVQR